MPSRTVTALRPARLLAAVAMLAALLGPIPPAGAGAGVTLMDDCIDYIHFPANPLFASPSEGRAIVTTNPELSGGVLFIEIDGASGEIMGEGTIDPRGIGIAPFPLFQFGEHRVTGLEIVPPGGGDPFPLDPTVLGDEGVFVVDENEPECDPDTMSLVAAAPTTTTSSTSTTTTTTEPESTSETTEPATSETSIPAETTPTTIEETTETSIQIIDTETGRSWIGYWWIGGLLILVGGGVYFLAKPSDPCIPEKGRWATAQKACDEAKAAATKARAACNDARAKVDGLKEDQKKVCKDWPPACWKTDEGSWIEDANVPGSRITSRDLHMREMALGDLWRDYQNGDVSAQDVEAAWERANTPEFREEMRAKDAAAKAKKAQIEKDLTQAGADAKKACDDADAADKKAKEACDEAAKRKREYEECIGKHSSGGAPESGGSESSGAPGGTPGVAGGGASGGGASGGGSGGTTGGGGEKPEGPGGPAVTTPPPSGPAPECGPGSSDPRTTKTAVVGTRTFTVTASGTSMELTVEPGTDDFAEWMETQLAGGGFLSPNKLGDPGFASEVASQLTDLDQGYGTANVATISVPRREVTYECVQHFGCQGGAWVATHKELRKTGEKALSPQRFSTASQGPKITSSDVARIVTQAQRAWQRLAEADAQIDTWCGQ